MWSHHLSPRCRPPRSPGTPKFPQISARLPPHQMSDLQTPRAPSTAREALASRHGAPPSPSPLPRPRPAPWPFLGGPAREGAGLEVGESSLEDILCRPRPFLAGEPGAAEPPGSPGLKRTGRAAFPLRPGGRKAALPESPLLCTHLDRADVIQCVGDQGLQFGESL